MMKAKKKSPKKAPKRLSKAARTRNSYASSNTAARRDSNQYRDNSYRFADPVDNESIYDMPYAGHERDDYFTNEYSGRDVDFGYDQIDPEEQRYIRSRTGPQQRGYHGQQNQNNRPYGMEAEDFDEDDYDLRQSRNESAEFHSDLDREYQDQSQVHAQPVRQKRYSTRTHTKREKNLQRNRAKTNNR